MVLGIVKVMETEGEVLGTGYQNAVVANKF